VPSWLPGQYRRVRTQRSRLQHPGAQPLEIQTTKDSTNTPTMRNHDEHHVTKQMRCGESSCRRGYQVSTVVSAGIQPFTPSAPGAQPLEIQTTEHSTNTQTMRNHDEHQGHEKCVVVSLRAVVVTRSIPSCPQASSGHAFSTRRSAVREIQTTKHSNW
jgi:hypothetical protein